MGRRRIAAIPDRVRGWGVVAGFRMIIGIGSDPSTLSSQCVRRDVLFAVREKELPLTETTLTPMLRHDTATAFVVRWDRETGWGHVAVVVPGAERPRFRAFHRFAEGDPVAVVAELVASGCVPVGAPHRFDDLMEVHALFARAEVAAHAAR